MCKIETVVRHGGGFVICPIELRTDQDSLVLQQALQRGYHRDTGEGRGGMAGDDLVELKFRLYDGTDIGPNKYAPASTIATLKESILSQWPQGEYPALAMSLCCFQFRFKTILNLHHHLELKKW